MREVLGVLGAEVVAQQRRVAHHRKRAGVFGVERAQRVQLDPAAHLLGELGLVRAQVGLQPLAVLAPAGDAAEAGEPQPQLAHAELGEQRCEQRDQLGVDGRVLGADRLGADLPELPVAPGLRALVAEEAGQVPELHGLAALVHAVLDVGPAHGGGALGPERQRAPGLVLEREHLLAHDVGGLADAAREQLGGLEHGRLDPLVAGALEDRAGARLDGAAARGLLAEHVEGAARRFDLRVAQRQAAGESAVAARGARSRSSLRNGLLARSRPSVVTPMCPGYTTVSSG